MKKQMIIFTSTSWDNDEFTECWMSCSDFNEDCFDNVIEKENEIIFKTSDFVLFVMNGKDFYSKIDWDYSKLKDKVKVLTGSIESSQTRVHLLLHSDEKKHLDELKKRFDKPTGLHLYSSATGDLWDYLVPLSEPCEPNEIDTLLDNLWERLENPPADADLKKPKDLMFALKHSLAKSKRLVWKFSEHCIKQHPEDLTPELAEKIMVRLERSRTILNDCLNLGILRTSTNEFISKIDQDFRKIEAQALEMKSTDLKITKKINIGFHCADNFSKILNIINEGKEG